MLPSLLLAINGAIGATLNVPADHPTVQSAVDAASSGDVMGAAPKRAAIYGPPPSWYRS